MPHNAGETSLQVTGALRVVGILLCPHHQPTNDGHYRDIQAQLGLVP